MYQLYALGIPIDAIPLNERGENKLQHHLSWIERQEYDDEKISSTNRRQLPLLPPAAAIRNNNMGPLLWHGNPVAIVEDED